VAFLALVASLIALVFRIAMYVHARRSIRSDVQRNLIRQQHDINNTAAGFNVAGPQEVIFRIDEHDLPEFAKKSAVLLKHLNLLQEVFHHQDILEREQVKYFKHWATNLVRPWIARDAMLKRIWDICRETKDLGPPKCQQWL